MAKTGCSTNVAKVGKTDEGIDELIKNLKKRGGNHEN